MGLNEAKLLLLKEQIMMAKPIGKLREAYLKLALKKEEGIWMEDSRGKRLFGKIQRFLERGMEKRTSN